MKRPRNRQAGQMKFSGYALLSMMVSPLVAGQYWLASPAYADDISPGVKGSGKTYSKDAPDTSYYGTGIGGRLEEAAMLRFQIDRALQDANFDQAITKARKACQLDPDTPDNHMLLARAMTKKLSTQGGSIDRKMLMEAMSEWNMLWHHDADQDDQWEAKMNYMRLHKTAVALARRKQAEEKEREKAKLALAQKTTTDDKKPVPKQTDSTSRTQAPAHKDGSATAAANGDQQTTNSTAEDGNSAKHKRFWLF